MLQTYELYIDQDDGSRVFRALTCRRAELITRAREEMATTQAVTGEVHQFGKALFTISAAEPDEAGAD